MTDPTPFTPSGHHHLLRALGWGLLALILLALTLAVE
jgi:hypothetical protein